MDKFSNSSGELFTVPVAEVISPAPAAPLLTSSVVKLYIQVPYEGHSVGEIIKVTPDVADKLINQSIARRI